MGPKVKLVEVEWEDAASSDIAWTELEDLECEIIKIHSIGYILKYDDKQISLVQNIHKDEKDRCFSHVINIPLHCVTVIHMLEHSTKVTDEI